MEPLLPVVLPVCCGIDVHKKSLTACLLTTGTSGQAVAQVRAFATELAKGITPVTVRLVDERMTTVTAAQGLRASGKNARKGRSVIDQAAAVIILQNALETERVSGNPPGECVEVVI